MVDALSRRYIIISTLNAKLLSFDYVKDLYAKDSDFANVYSFMRNKPMISFIDFDVICLKRINFMCLIVLCLNYLYVKLMRVV